MAKLTDSEYLLQRLQCSRADKQDCLRTVKQLIRLAELAKMGGLLALDAEVNENPEEYPQPFLRKAVQVTADVGKQELVRKVLYNFLYSSQLAGRNLLNAIIITETMLAIHHNDDMNYIFMFLLPSYFGIDFESMVTQVYEDYKKARHLDGEA